MSCLSKTNEGVLSYLDVYQRVSAGGRWTKLHLGHSQYYLSM